VYLNEIQDSWQSYTAMILDWIWEWMWCDFTVWLVYHRPCTVAWM